MVLVNFSSSNISIPSFSELQLPFHGPSFSIPHSTHQKKPYGCWFQAKSQAQILCAFSHSSFLHQFTSLPFFTFWSFLFFPFTTSLPIISTHYCYICHWHNLFFTNNIFLSLKKRMEELLNCHPIIYNHHLLLVY